MSLKSKIEAVIYASEEPVTLPQLAGLLGEEVEAELEALAALQTLLPLDQGTRAQSRAPHADSAEVVTGGTDTSPTFANGSPVITLDASAQLDSIEDANTVASSTRLSPLRLSLLAAEIEAPATQPQTLSEVAPDPRLARERERRVREHLRRTIDTLIRDYADSDRGIEIREVAGGFRMGTKPEYHDAVRGFVKSLKPALKLTLQALETLAVVAYKQPVTAAEISEIRGVDSAGVLGGLMARKLIATAGRKQVIGRPMLYKTTKEFLVRFGLKDVQELPSMEEFERLAGELREQEDLPMEPTGILIERANARGDADHIREVTGDTPDEGDAMASPSVDPTRDAAFLAEGVEQNRADTPATNDASEPTENDPPGSHPTSAEMAPEAEPSAAVHPTSSTTEPQA